MKHIMVLLVYACLLGSGMQASFAAAASESLQRWDFQTAGDSEGWKIGFGLSDLTVAEGLLRMQIKAPDAFVIAPPIEVPLDGCAVRVRLRADREGRTQVYWRSSAHPAFGEPRQMTRYTTAAPAAASDGGFQIVEFEIGTPTDAGEKLTGFRIDTFNGNTDGTVEIDWVELVRKSAVFQSGLHFENHRVCKGEPVKLEARLQQMAGKAVEGAVVFELAGTRQEQAFHETKASAKTTSAFQPERTGLHRERAVVRVAQEQFTADLEASVVVGSVEELAVVSGLIGKQLRLDLVPTMDGAAVGAVRWQIADEVSPSGAVKTWRLAGWLLPLAAITVETEPGRVVQREPVFKMVEQSNHRLRLRAEIEGLSEWGLHLDLSIGQESGREFIQVSSTLRGPTGGRLLDYSVPVLRVEGQEKGDLLDRFAIFGGLEYLEPGWRSSSERAVGERFADRWSPHPFKITLPVMAIEQGGMACGLMWQPLEKWNERDSLPTATFVSPNFLDGQPHHLMKLSVPTIDQWREENESCARNAYVMQADQPLTLRGVLYAEKNLPVTMMARRWYEIFSAPNAPPPTHDDKTLYDLLARHFGETMYWPEEKGWRHHWYMEQKSHFVGWMAAELLAHKIETGQDEWVRRTELTDKASVIDVAGTLESRFLYGGGGAKAIMASMRPDGSWPFANTEKMRETTREVTNGQYDSLGEDGSTSLGTCVQAALSILRHAELSGDPACTIASLKALEAMKRFRVPRGAQVWEVHQEIPDIRAAALAIEAYQIGYHLTGDEKWLDEAEYWAWTGVPFLYSWHVPIEERPGVVIASRDRDENSRIRLSPAEAFQNPNRQVTPYGSIPVLGPTFYVGSWFGVIVQWCGMEWALNVLELQRDRADPLLRQLADGVVASGLQQMFDRPPWIGLYPDVWDTRENAAQGVFICARLPIRCLQAQRRVPYWTQTWTRVLRDASTKRRWHVSGWGEPIALASPVEGGSWTAKISFWPSQPNELIIAGIDRPRGILIDGTPMSDPSAADPLKKEGWYYHAPGQAAVVRFTQRKAETELRIEW